MQGTILGNQGSSSGLNVYAQLAEPNKKDGIWIKTEKTLRNELNYTKLSDIPFNFYNQPTAAVEKKIYLFGNNFGGNTDVYKFDIELDTYTSLINSPTYFNQGSAVAIGTNIYLFGGQYGKYAYKYDITTDTYTKLPDIPYNFHYGSAVVVGTNIYLFSGDSGYGKYAYKYDITTDIYTKLPDIPYNFQQGLLTAVSTDIYLFGGYNNTLAYKYSTITDTYEKLTNATYTFYQGSACAIGTNIYLFAENYAYRYNTLYNTYTQLSNIPYNFTNGSSEVIEDEIYLIGSGANENVYKTSYTVSLVAYSEIIKYKYTGIELISSLTNEENVLINKNIYVETEQTHKIKLTKNMQAFISNAKIYEDNELKGYPCYWGDGEKWNLIS